MCFRSILGIRVLTEVPVSERICVDEHCGGGVVQYIKKGCDMFDKAPTRFCILRLNFKRMPRIYY